MNGWARVPSAVIVKRSELGLTQRELAVKAGVAERTIQNLEAGKRPQPLIRGKIERALGWPSGEMDRIATAPAAPKPPPIPPEVLDYIRNSGRYDREQQEYLIGKLLDPTGPSPAEEAPSEPGDASSRRAG